MNRSEQLYVWDEGTYILKQTPKATRNSFVWFYLSKYFTLITLLYNHSNMTACSNLLLEGNHF